jgi:hypothetical protein
VPHDEKPAPFLTIDELDAILLQLAMTRASSDSLLARRLATELRVVHLALDAALARELHLAALLIEAFSKARKVTQ